MAMNRPRVLFVSHSASRNGATILLLSFLRWLKPRVDWDIEVLMNGSGPLLHEFEAIAKTAVWRDPGPKLRTLFPHASQSALRRAVAAGARWMLPSGDFDLVYANTTAAASAVTLLGKRARVVLWHVHELSYAMSSSLALPDQLERFRSATRYVAVSEAVRAALASDHAIDESRIDLAHGFIAPFAFGPDGHRAKRASVRARLGIDEGAFVVGGCGSLGWRKGTDLFLQVASRLMSLDVCRDVHFLWVGGTPGEPAIMEFNHDVRSLGLSQRCRLIANTTEVSDHYCAMDAFALTSREDPFPLVVLEAADHGLPIVCFDGAGGANEFVASDAGLRVPYLDVAGFAACLALLCTDRELSMQLGACARLKVQRNHRVDSQGPKLLQSMQQLMAEIARTDSTARHDCGDAANLRTH